LKELVLLLSTRCNANCSFCTQSHNGINMTKERLEEIILEAAASKDLSNVSLELFGGEPLLNFKLIQEIFSDNDSKISKILYDFKRIKITTNGLLLNKEIYEFFSTLNKKIEVTVTISYDGIFQEQRGYQLPDTVKEIIKLDAKSNQIIKISFGVYNYPERILDQYLSIKEEFNLSSDQIDFYFNRNYYKYPADAASKFRIGFMKLLIYLDTFRLPLPNRLKEYHLRILGEISPSEGCGAGIKRFAYSENSKLKCGIIDTKNDIDVPTQYEFDQMCSGCEIIDQCPRKCPIMLKRAYEDNLNQNNTVCDIHKIIVQSIKKYYI